MKTVLDVVNPLEMNQSVIFGYYGGGNFGDELLLEVLLDLCENASVKDVKFVYRNREMYPIMHRTRDYQPLFGLRELIVASIKSRTIVVGGGGHWGLDMNPSVLLMSVLLLVFRLVLRKKIYLLGVGFYNSTSRLGRISAWIAATASTQVVARDEESYYNFMRFYPSKTHLDKDIVFYLPNLDLKKYDDSAQKIATELNIEEGINYTLVAFRRFQVKHSNQFNYLVEQTVTDNPQQHFITMTLEPESVDPEGSERLRYIHANNENTVVSDFHFNPLAFACFLEKNAKTIQMVAPQYHAQLIAHLVGIRHMPIVYDNKVEQLLIGFNISEVIPITLVTSDEINNFVRI